MPTTTKHKLQFVHAMARHTRATVRQCEALLRYAHTLQRLAVEACNRELTDKEREKEIRVIARVQALMTEIEADEDQHCHGAVTKHPVAITDGDLRGCVLKIRVPDGFSDDGNGEGICVPA